MEKKRETDATTSEASNPRRASTSTTQAMNSTKIPLVKRNDLRELLVAVFGQKKDSLIAKEQSPLDVCFVVKNLKMKNTLSEGVQVRGALP